MSPRFASEVGVETAVAWPVGVGGKGNEGVASYVSRIAGAIGYIEHAYLIGNRLAHARLQNRSGRWVAPTRKAFAAAASHADWAAAPGFYRLLTDQPGDESWPITGASFILMRRSPRDPAAAAAALGFFDWAYQQGGAMAEGLDYVPMPEAVTELAEAAWVQIRDAAGQPVR
jgi:phosphate transport system substrate-binding protein